MKKVRKKFNFREGKKLLDCITRNYAQGMYAAYVGVKDTRDVILIKKHGKPIQWMINNYSRLPEGFRQLALNEAIWEGTDFSKQEEVDRLTGANKSFEPYVLVSGFDQKGVPFAYSLNNEEAINNMVDMAITHDTEKGPAANIVHSNANGDAEKYVIRNLATLKKVIKLAKSTGTELQIKEE